MSFMDVMSKGVLNVDQMSKYASAISDVKIAYDVYEYFVPESGFHSTMTKQEVGSASPFRKDARDTTRSNGEYLRKARGLATGGAFNKNEVAGSKRHQFATTADHLIQQECIDLLSLNRSRLEEFFPINEFGQNIQRIETHMTMISQLRYNKMMTINEACKLTQEYKLLGENPDSAKSKELTDAVVRALAVITPVR